MKNENYGPNIRAILKKKGVTQAELAQKVGLKCCTISLLLSGQRGFTEKTLNAILNVLGIKESDLDKDCMSAVTRRYAKQIPNFNIDSFKAGIQAAKEGLV